MQMHKLKKLHACINTRALRTNINAWHLLKIAHNLRCEQMPVLEGTPTSYIIRNIRDSVIKYNRFHSAYVHDYQSFIRERSRLPRFHNAGFIQLLHDPGFTVQLQDILIKFGMNARAAELTPHQRFLETVSRVGPDFQLLNITQTRLYALDLNQMIGTRTLYPLIRNVFSNFAKPTKLSMAGGFVVASKTMHFIMPELFVMVDGQHIGISLYNIVDYHPHPDDGRDWFDVVPNYSGRKPNPSPRGEGRKSWDSERYCIALMYYKRIINEWRQQNNSNIESFHDLDSCANTPARIIDKALW